MKKNVLVLLILLTPINIVFSQTDEKNDWFDLDENSVINYLRKYGTNTILKKNLSDGFNVFSITYKDIVGGEKTESVMFDGGDPIYRTRMWIFSDQKNSYGDYEKLEGWKEVFKKEINKIKVKRNSSKYSSKILINEEYKFVFSEEHSDYDQEFQMSFNIDNNNLLVFMISDTYSRPVGKIKKIIKENINNGKIDVSKLNFYDINYLIDLFIDQFTYSYTEYYKKNNLSILNHEKFTGFLDKINNSKRNVNFDLNKEGVLGVSNSMYDDSSISLSINPSLWKTSSDSKKLYVLFHELGHDILNFRHGEGGKMMFTISESDYSFKDFYNDKDYMFKSFFKSFFN